MQKYKEWKQRIGKMLKSDKAFIVCVILLLACSILPLLVIGKYNVMAADDYSFGRHFHQVWEETHSFSALWRLTLQSIPTIWQTWQGCFTIQFFDAWNPGYYSEGFMWIIPCLAIFSICFSTYMLLNTVTQKYFQYVKQEMLVVWSLWVFLVLQTMVSPAEGFYWYSGSIGYTVLQYFMLLLFCFLLKCETNKSRSKKGVYICIVIIYAFIVGGCQYITVLECLLWYGVYLLLRRKKIQWWQLIGGISLCAGFFLSVLAPGNAQRRGGTNGMAPIPAILHSFTEAFRYAKEWMSPMFFVIVLLSVPFIWKMIRKQKEEYAFHYPVLTIILAGCFFSASFTPALYGVGNVTAGRILNLTQGIFYIMVWVVLYYCLGWLNYKVNHSEKEFFADCATIMKTCGKYFRAYRWVGLLAVLLVLVGTGDKNTFSSLSALRSLLTGEAQTYRAEADERLTLYLDETVDIVEVEPFSVKPKVLFFNDLQEEDSVEYWINKSVAAYYHKEKVILKNLQ